MYSDKDYRIDLIRGMNAIVISMNNENAYMRWINIVPDQCDDDDLEYIAESDELFTETVQLFVKIMKWYLKDGLYILGKLYK